MNIGAVAKGTDLPAKSIRYYEDIGLIKPRRTADGYRKYSGNDLHRLCFLQRARSLGFSISECRSLFSLYEDQNRASVDVKAITMDKIRKIDCKLDELRPLRSTLEKLADHCSELRSLVFANTTGRLAICLHICAEQANGGQRLARLLHAFEQSGNLAMYRNG